MFLKINVKKFNALMLNCCCKNVLFNYKVINKKQSYCFINTNYLKQFKRKTNLSKSIIIIKKIKIIFFNNFEFFKDILNNTIDLIVEINKNNCSIIAFFKIDKVEIKSCFINSNK